MTAAALIPLLVVVTLVVMFASGVLPFPLFAGILVLSLLVGMVVALAQLLDQMEAPGARAR